MEFKELVLEISLKPFHDPGRAGVAVVADRLFSQWRPLIVASEKVSVMFWTADGSEILEYSGNEGDPFEWCRHIGVANAMEAPEGMTALPPELRSIHSHPVCYRDDAPTFTYRDLKRILTVLRERFHARFGRRLGLVATFDPGPEFAVSPFKYERHPELCLADTLGKGSFLCCYANLRGDDHAYAGFPDGIPDGISFGTFFGRQTERFCADMGFDGIWFSNGFGFGLETWRATGTLFDGRSFDTGRCDEVRRKIFAFWDDFRAECPALPIKTRGTNFTTGKDLSSDGVPLREIYRRVPGIEPPPNSPWAALNDDFGLELVGWMSHIAELPGTDYPFRFYIHDPWFINSPWLDRYNRSPHDIFLPMSLCRLDGGGGVGRPSILNFLSVDDSLGRMPEQVPLEVIPCILQARRTAPDAPGPFIWLYPFDDYHDMAFADGNLEEVFFGDWFMRGAVNSGFPLNTVVSTGNFLPAIAQGTSFSGNLIIAPTAVERTPDVFDQLMVFIRAGGGVLFYGPPGPRTRRLFSLLQAPPLTGEMIVTDGRGTAMGKTFCRPELCGGGMACEKDENGSACVEVDAWYHQDGARRPAVVSRCDSEWRGGRAVWVRGGNSFTFEDGGFMPLDRNLWLHHETLALQALQRFGWICRPVKRCPAQPEPILTVRRHRGGLHAAHYAPDTTVGLQLRFPGGMPILTGTEAFIQDGVAGYALAKTADFECRVLLDQKPSGVVKCREWTVGVPRFKRCIELSGLKDAVVRFLPEPGSEPCIQRDGAFSRPVAPLRTVSLPEGEAVEINSVDGTLLIRW